MEHLIADSGIQFITKEIEFNPSEPLLLQRGGTLKYSHIKNAKNNAIKQQKLCFLLCHARISVDSRALRLVLMWPSGSSAIMLVEYAKNVPVLIYC